VFQDAGCHFAGIQAVIHGLQDVIHGLQDVIHGLQDVIHGLQDVIHGLQDVIHGLVPWIVSARFQSSDDILAASFRSPGHAR
jgi:hypothetical protein